MANEKRLIDANALIKNGWHLVQTGKSNVFLASMSLADVPTVDAVEVVRCKDCKKWEYDENFSGWCVEWRRRTLGDHFCSYGERREGE